MRAGSGCRTVAERAACGKSRGDVIGVRGPRKVLLVARIAVCWRTREDVVDMARRTRNAYVCSGQRERRLVVVELGAVPCCCVVTGSAGRGEVRRNVVGIAGPGEVMVANGMVYVNSFNPQKSSAVLLAFSVEKTH